MTRIWNDNLRVYEEVFSSPIIFHRYYQWILFTVRIQQCILRVILEPREMRSCQEIAAMDESGDRKQFAHSSLDTVLQQLKVFFFFYLYILCFIYLLFCFAMAEFLLA